MRKLREFLRLHFVNKLSGRAIAKSLGISPSTAQGYVGRIRVSGLTWPLPPELDSDEALSRRLFEDDQHTKRAWPEPDWASVHVELKKKGVTKQLLWEEYKAGQPDGIQYSAFCLHYLRWAVRLSLTMRQEHRVGEKLFIDFSGDGLDVIDPKTGEVSKAKLFVAVLGASSYTYVEPVLNEDLRTWTQCHVNALDFFEGATELWVPDNLKAGVTKPDRYEPDLNPTYADLASHYGVAVIPARVRKPRDKAKVEAAVLLAERWILAALRKHTFFSLADVRAAVKPLLEKLNNRVMRRLKKSRRQLYEELERPALKALPTQRWEFSEWRKEKVGPSYHVSFKDHFYSVPYILVGQHVEIRATGTTVEILRAGRVASHVRDDTPGKYTTAAEHMPRPHRDYAEWDPPRLIAWAKTVGPATAELVEGIMLRRKHPQHGFNSCLGVMSLRKTYEDERIEAACARAVTRRAFSYQSVKAILRNGLDRQPLEEELQQALPLHENIRGPDYYN